MKKIIGLLLFTATTALFSSELTKKRDEYLIEHAEDLATVFFEEEYPKGTSARLLLETVEHMMKITILRDDRPLTPHHHQHGKENRPSSVPVNERPSFGKALSQVAGFLFSLREENDRLEVAEIFKKTITDQIAIKSNEQAQTRFRSITPHS